MNEEFRVPSAAPEAASPFSMLRVVTPSILKPLTGREQALTFREKIVLGGEAVALWFLIGGAWGMGVWSTVMGRMLAPFVHGNNIPPQYRLGLLLSMGLTAVGLAGVAALMYWRSTDGSAQRYKDAALRLSPSVAFGLLPLLLSWSLWPGREVVALTLIALSGLLVELTTRKSLAVGPVLLSPAQRERVAAFMARVKQARWFKWGPAALVALGVIGYSVVFSIFTLRNHYRFSTADFDLGIENNLIWNAIHWGPLFKSSPLGGPDAVHTGLHQTFFAYIIGIPYRLYPHPEFLLVFQSVMIAAAAIPLYIWGRGKVGPWLAAVLALAYLVYPPVHGANLYDFHYQPLGPFFVWTALILFERGHFKWAALATLLVFSLREDMPLMMAVVAAYLFLSKQRPVAAVVLGLVSMAVFVVQKGIIMPRFLGGEEAYIHQYAQMVAPGERGFSSVVKTLLMNPAFTLDKLLERDKGIFALQLFAPLVFVPFRQPMGFLFCLPVFFFNFLSTAYWPLTQISFQYTVYASMFVFLAVGHAWWKLSDPLRVRSMAAGLVVAMAGASAIFGGLFQQNTAKGAWELMRMTLTEEDHVRHRNFEEIVAPIPPMAKVAGSGRMGPQLSSRPDCYTLRQTVADTEFIIYEAGRLGDNEKATIRRYIEKGEFGLLDQKGSFYLLKRGHDASRNDLVSASVR